MSDTKFFIVFDNNCMSGVSCHKSARNAYIFLSRTVCVYDCVYEK